MPDIEGLGPQPSLEEFRAPGNTPVADYTPAAEKAANGDNPTFPAITFANGKDVRATYVAPPQGTGSLTSACPAKGL